MSLFFGLQGMWDLAAQTGVEPAFLALERTLNQWTTREVPIVPFSFEREKVARGFVRQGKFVFHIHSCPRSPCPSSSPSDYHLVSFQDSCVSSGTLLRHAVKTDKSRAAQAELDSQRYLKAVYHDCSDEKVSFNEVI